MKTTPVKAEKEKKPRKETGKKEAKTETAFGSVVPAFMTYDIKI